MPQSLFRRMLFGSTPYFAPAKTRFASFIIVASVWRFVSTSASVPPAKMSPRSLKWIVVNTRGLCGNCAVLVTGSART